MSEGTRTFTTHSGEYIPHPVAVTSALFLTVIRFVVVSIVQKQALVTPFIYVAVRCMSCMQMTKAKLRKYSKVLQKQNTSVIMNVSLLRSFNADCAKAVLKGRYLIGRGVSPCKIASATVWLQSLSVAEMPDVKSESPFGASAPLSNRSSGCGFFRSLREKSHKSHQIQQNKF